MNKSAAGILNSMHFVIWEALQESILFLCLFRYCSKGPSNAFLPYQDLVLKTKSHNILNSIAWLYLYWYFRWLFVCPAIGDQTIEPLGAENWCTGVN